jgi:type IV fimbrial biogenesis protein FimT
MPAMKSRQSGFTLIELMVSLLVLSILFAAAVPSFREFTRNNRIVATQNDFVTAMSLARSEAIKQSRNVTLCSSADGQSCSGSTDWASGWIVTVPGGGLLQTWSAPGGDIVTEGTASSLTYEPLGTVTAGGQFTIRAPECTGLRAHQITVLIAGAAQSAMTNCPE